MPALRSFMARAYVPRAAFRAYPLQHLEVPAQAAAEHVSRSHGQPSARNTFNSSSCPLLAAAAQRSSRRDRRPCRCRRFKTLKHPRITARSSPSSSSRSPVAATAPRIARLTAGSRARSAWSSKFSDLRTCVTTRWSGRPGIASCGEDSCVSVASATRALLRERLAAPLSDLEGMLVSGGWVRVVVRRCFREKRF